MHHLYRPRLLVILLGLCACGDGKGTSTESDIPATTTGGATDGLSSTDGGDATGIPMMSAPTVTGDATSMPMMTAPTVTGDTAGMMTTNLTTVAEPDTGEPVEPCAGEPVPIDAEVIAYLESQVSGPIDTEAGTTGDDVDPTLLYVRFSDLAFTCDAPHDRLQCGEHWELSLRIPAAFQAPGLYALSLDDVHAFGLSTGVDLGGDECDGGGGGAQGTLEIFSIDEQAVTGRLCDVTWFGLDGDFELDGSFVAPRCPP